MPTVSNDAVEQVRERTDIVELIGQQVTLKKSGRNFKGLCPFHQEKTPSFYVFPDDQHFKCFGCGAGGDAFSFVMQSERVDFKEALRTLAERAGVELAAAPPPPSAGQVEQHARLFELNSRAANFFSHVLWNTQSGEPARQMLERRGVDRATAERFQLGYAPDRWDALLSISTKRGATVEELIAAGLVTPREDGGAYDRFRGRLIFPIRDREGRIVGFGGRLLGDGQPKYLNTPQTDIFDKSANLYALDLAQDAIRAARKVVVVEGYMDAIAAHQFGYLNVVASMGTALTEQQVRLVRRGVDEIILALDADAAGQKAARRGLDVMRETLGEAGEPIIDPRGAIRFSRDLKANIVVARITSGKDPDELIRTDPNAWRETLAHPVPFIDFYIDAVIGDPPPSDPRQIDEVVEDLAGVLREIGSPVETGAYARRVAERLGINELDVRKVIATPKKQSRARGAPVRQRARSAQPTPVANPEEHLFAMLVSYPLVITALLDQFPESDILDARNLEILRLVRSVVPTEIEATLADVPDELFPHVEALRARFSDRPAVYPGQLRQEAEQVIRRLRRERYDERLRQLQEEVRSAAEEGDRDELRRLLALLDQHKALSPEFYPNKSPYFLDARDAGR